MRNSIVWTLASLGLLVLAFVAGVFAQRQYQLAKIRAVEKVAREFTGLDDPVPLAPAWESWRYPRAKNVGSIEGQALRVMGKLERPGGHYAVLVTPDGVEDFAKFYAEKIQFENPEEAAKSTSATSVSSTLQGKSEMVLDDSLASPSDSNQSRPVRVKCLAGRNRSFAVSVFITRASGEQQTHIVLLYDPLVESALKAN